MKDWGLKECTVHRVIPRSEKGGEGGNEEGVTCVRLVLGAGALMTGIPFWGKGEHMTQSKT